MRIKICCIIGLIIIAITIVYFNYQESEIIDYDYDQIVLKDSSDELIPITVEMSQNLTDEEIIRNKIDLMKSHDYEQYGLYPVLNEQLTLEGIENSNGFLELDFTSLSDQKNGLDLLEIINYCFLGDNLDGIILKEKGKTVSHVDNIPITQQAVSLNNFLSDEGILANTKGYVAYTLKTIKDRDFYLPVTYRLSESLSLEKLVQSLLYYVSDSIDVKGVSLNNHKLEVQLSSQLLEDDNTINKQLKEMITLTLSSIPEVEDVVILIDEQVIEHEKVSSILYNYVKI